MTTIRKLLNDSPAKVEAENFRKLLIAHKVDLNLSITKPVTLRRLAAPKKFSQFNENSAIEISLLEIAAYQSCWTIVDTLLDIGTWNQETKNKAVILALRKKNLTVVKKLIRLNAEQPMHGEERIYHYRLLKAEIDKEKKKKKPTGSPIFHVKIERSPSYVAEKPHKTTYSR